MKHLYQGIWKKKIAKRILQNCYDIPLVKLNQMQIVMTSINPLDRFCAHGMMELCSNILSSVFSDTERNKPVFRCYIVATSTRCT